MIEYSHGHGMGAFGAMTESRLQHQSFYGTAAKVTETHALGATHAELVINKLADEEWKKAGLEGIFPKELVNLIGQLTTGIGSQLETVMDFLAEAASAEALRQKFGEPQVPGALSVAIKLTSLAEEAFEATQSVATQAERKINQLRSEIQKTILVWLLAEEARHQATVTNFEKTSQEISSLKVTTRQANSEVVSAQGALSTRKEEVNLLLKKAIENVNNFFNLTFSSQTLKTAEVIVYSARQSTSELPELDFKKAIPIMLAS